MGFIPRWTAWNFEEVHNSFILWSVHLNLVLLRIKVLEFLIQLQIRHKDDACSDRKGFSLLEMVTMLPLEPQWNKNVATTINKVSKVRETLFPKEFFFSNLKKLSYPSSQHPGWQYPDAKSPRAYTSSFHKSSKLSFSLKFIMKLYPSPRRVHSAIHIHQLKLKQKSLSIAQFTPAGKVHSCT